MRVYDFRGSLPLTSFVYESPLDGSPQAWHPRSDHQFIVDQAPELTALASTRDGTASPLSHEEIEDLLDEHDWSISYAAGHPQSASDCQIYARRGVEPVVVHQRLGDTHFWIVIAYENDLLAFTTQIAPQITADLFTFTTLNELPPEGYDTLEEDGDEDSFIYATESEYPTEVE